MNLGQNHFLLTMIDRCVQIYIKFPSYHTLSVAYLLTISCTRSFFFLNLFKNYCSKLTSITVLQGYKGADKFYIACQAPMQSTLPDFWQMIWEQNTRVVMMVTSLTEKGVVSLCFFKNYN